MPYIEGKDIKIFYEDIGIGDPVLFLHSSFSRGIISFSAQIMEFQSEFRCILPDMRGHGRTMAERLEWNMPQLADDAIALLDALGIEKAHVIGFSLGGDIAFYCAMKYPQRIKSFISIGAAGTINDVVLENANNYEPDRLMGNGYNSYVELIKNNHQDAHKGDWRKLVETTIYNWRNFPVFSDEELRNLNVPCMMIVGEKDRGVLPEELDRLEKLVANVRIEKIQDCGHGPHLIFEKPLMINKLMKQFLKEKKSS